MKYNYICVKQDLWHKDIGDYTSYGIALNDQNNILQSDVCCEKDAASSLVLLLNENQVEPEHVKYVVEDVIYCDSAK